MITPETAGIERPRDTEEKSPRQARLKHGSKGRRALNAAVDQLPDDIIKDFLKPDSSESVRPEEVILAMPPVEPVLKTALLKKEKTVGIVGTVLNAFRPREDAVGIAARKSLRRSALLRPFFKGSAKAGNKDALLKISVSKQLSPDAEDVLPVAEAAQPDTVIQEPELPAPAVDTIIAEEPSPQEDVGEGQAQYKGKRVTVTRYEGGEVASGRKYVVVDKTLVVPLDEITYTEDKPHAISADRQDDVPVPAQLSGTERIAVEEVQPEENKALTQPVQELLSSLSREIPGVFRRQAAWAAEYIARLDGNFDEAITDEEIRIFLRQLRSSGFVDRADGYSSVKEEIELPRWLNRKLLEAKGVLPESRQLSEDEVINKDVVDDIRNMLAHDMTGEAPTPKDFQYCIEGGGLFTGLEEGRIKDALSELIALGIQPRSMNFLAQENSLVLFFNQRIEEFHRVNTVLEKYGVVGRGPTQDVYALETGEKKFLREREIRRVLVASNDDALGKAEFPHADYTQSHYTPEGFLRAYLEQLVLYGKNPVRPYETSFVYIRDSERLQKPLEPSEITKLERRAYGLTWYPVAYVGTGSLGLLAKQYPEGPLKRLRGTVSAKWQKSHEAL